MSSLLDLMEKEETDISSEKIKKGFDEFGRKYQIEIKDNKKIKTVYDNKYRLMDFLSPTTIELLLFSFEGGFYSPAMAWLMCQNRSWNINTAEYLALLILPQMVTYGTSRIIEIFSKEKIKDTIKKEKLTNHEYRPIYQEITDLKTNKTKKENWIYFP